MINTVFFGLQLKLSFFNLVYLDIASTFGSTEPSSSTEDKDKSYSFLSSLIMSHNDLLHLDKTIILLVIVVLNIQYLNVVIRSTYTQMRPFSILLLASPLLASPFLLTPSFLGAGTAAFITLVKYHTFLQTFLSFFYLIFY